MSIILFASLIDEISLSPLCLIENAKWSGASSVNLALTSNVFVFPFIPYCVTIANLNTLWLADYIKSAYYLNFQSLPQNLISIATNLGKITFFVNSDVAFIIISVYFKILKLY